MQKLVELGLAISLTLELHIGGSVFSLFALFCTFCVLVCTFWSASLFDQLLDARFVELGLDISLTLELHIGADQFSLYLHRNGSICTAMDHPGSI